MRTAGRAIELNDASFETYLDELRGRNWDVLWRQDSFVMGRFTMLQGCAHQFPDAAGYAALIADGAQAVRADDMAKLRTVVSALEARRVRGGDLEDAGAAANIVAA